MIYSTIHNKNTNEDPKTSMVFGNLMLLPDNVFWHILKTATSNHDILPEDAGLMDGCFEFWPKWNPNSKYDTGNANYVEPDVFFHFEYIDIILEAKYSDNQGQSDAEWEREFKAYLNEYEDDRKQVFLLAVGGNSNLKRVEPLVVENHKWPIVKYSWVQLLNVILSYEKEYLSSIQTDVQSSTKRIIRNLEAGFSIIGIHKYKQKMKLEGLRNLFIFGRAFENAVTREADLYTLTKHKDDVNSYHYGVHFLLTPKDGRRKTIKLSIALWINDQEVICIGAKYDDDWAGRLCKSIEAGKKFSSKYLNSPYLEYNC